MSDQALSPKAAYVANIRKLHRGKRLLGMAGCLVGVLLMISSAYIAGAPQWLRFAGLAVIAASWMLFIFVLVSRTRYVRAHPFDLGN